MINIAVCDDEPLAISLLVGKIQTYMKIKQMNYTMTKFSDGETLLSNLNKNKKRFDAIYLDIKMNQINGIDTAKAIRKTDTQTMIIFVSALKEYVFEAFDVNAINFLLKPISDHKLFSTLDKILVQKNTLTRQSLIISAAGEVQKIPFDNIVYCEVLNHRLFVYEKDCMHEWAGKIEFLEKELNGDFFRCHRSYIVNLRFVDKYMEGFAFLSSLEKIPVATRRKQEFMQALLRFHRNEVR